MEKQEAILADLEQLRESAAALIRARLDAVTGQIRDLSSRALGDLSVVIPPDLETLFPISGLSERLDALVKAAVPVGVSLEVVRCLDGGRAQSEVLQEFLRQIGAWCGPRAIVVLRDGNAQGWSGAGFLGGDPARGWRGALADSPALAQAADGAPVLTRPRHDPVLAGWFDGSERLLLLVPMSLRGKMVGVLLALEGETGLDVPVIQQLTYTVGLMLETLAGRTGVPTAALREPEDMTGAVTAAPTAEKAPAPELFEIEEHAPHPAPPEVTPPVADASATVHLKVPVAPALPVPPVAPPPPPVPARSPEEERKHEEARRFARLLVSEIRLYNEQPVQAGKIARDIYQRLKDDIDRSREMYEQRVSLDVRANSNYFFDELVRILADGEPDALGM